MSTIMPGLVCNLPTSTSDNTEQSRKLGLGQEEGRPNSSAGLAHDSMGMNGQFRKEFGNLKVPVDDCRYDSGIDSFKQSDLQALQDEAEYEQNEQFVSNNSTIVAEQFRDLNINDEDEVPVGQHQYQCTIDEDGGYEDVDDARCCSMSVCHCLTPDAFNQDEEGDTPLHSSIIYNSPQYAHKFISCSPCVEYLSIQNKLRQTPMHLSVIMNQDEIVRQLVVSGANLEIQDQSGQTALHLACKYDNLKLVQTLTQPITDQERYKWPGRFLEQPIPQNLELQNFEGYTCLHLASFGGNSEILQYLVDLGCDVNARDGKSGRTALHHAIEQGKTDLIKFLVHTLNADVDVLTFDHCTPLHLAVSRKFGEAIAVLMDANADRSIANSEGLKADQLHSYKSTFCN
ncbi:NF-kappa-B inhibitor epsilon-like [Antedon mediterranea]|uniref:NF-kappa-B inhibitor epsilon-like n=1 Tax=Antedon mediterranea TaxID=105859 RepID=UPI003AF74C71